MGNEASSPKSVPLRSSDEVPKKKNSKCIFLDKNMRQDSNESNDSGIITTPTPVGILIKRKISAPSSARQQRTLPSARNSSFDGSRGLSKSLSRDHTEENYSPDEEREKKKEAEKHSKWGQSIHQNLT
ncbi:hypothetical protein Tcan_12125 [Toxocara canis]|uniref:Uncharacterized protein n=1 Tax=Toxocara canis TaxID=6265 RepID=A0A0B2UT62_TOXCA|nr:hypothetical protein Tcan_12125 [Toxocara canis]